MKALLCTGLIAAALLGSRTMNAQVHASETPQPAAETPTPEPMDRSIPQPVSPGPASSAVLADSHVFRYEDMTARTAPNGSQARAITHGTLRTGESVNLHESTQPAGTAAVALHTIQHTEFICVQQGTVTFDHVDATGKTISEQAGAGSVIYVAEGTNHRIRNAGNEPAQYFVIAIGGDAK